MSNPVVQVKNLTIEFVTKEQITQVVQDISFTVNKGEIVAIVGESGSGKSVSSLSILRLLSSPPVRYPQGEIIFSSAEKTIDLLRASENQLTGLRGNHIAMIFQEPMTSLNPVLTCGQQVMEAIITHRKIKQKEALQQTIRLFRQVQLPDPEKIIHKYPHQLSGGQKQRVMIAMAMSCQPELLICDEPTTALDVTVQQNILQLIQQLQKQNNMAVIFITHDLGVVAEIADRVLVMYKGKIVEENNTKELFQHPTHPYTKALLACRPVLYHRHERLPVVSDFLAGKIEEAGAKKPETKTEYHPAKQAQPILSVQNLEVQYPLQKNFLGKPLAFTNAVNDVTFEVCAGETVGLVGESGCGKSTLGRTILKLVNPTQGKIFYKGRDMNLLTKDETKLLRKDMQLIFQDPYSSLNPRMKIGAAIAEPLLVHKLASSTRERKERVIDLLEKVNLTAEHYNRYPHEFSGGQRQRIVIARALAVQPSFIICDESVSALDVSVQAQVLNLLNDLKKEFNFTAIFISHDLAVVRYISDRIMVMHKGKIVETGDAEEVYANPIHPYTQQLIASIPKGIVA
ncbi:MAG: ABC transporter ATP-binding protein [Bacteroidota bacterium]|nr:ABC transporter ATP-binding protein [Bacteroidota bacterium]